MALQTVSFRLPVERLEALDFLVELQQRGRSFAINEAVAQYLSLNAYHRDLVEEGIRQDDAGEVIGHRALMTTAASWGRKRKAR